MAGSINRCVVARLFRTKSFEQNRRGSLRAACALGALMRRAWKLRKHFARRLRAWCATTTALGVMVFSAMVKACSNSTRGANLFGLGPGGFARLLARLVFVSQKERRGGSSGSSRPPPREASPEGKPSEFLTTARLVEKEDAALPRHTEDGHPSMHCARAWSARLVAPGVCAHPRVHRNVMQVCDAQDTKHRTQQAQHCSI